MENTYEHTPKQMAEKLMFFNKDFSDYEEEMENEEQYLTELFDKLQKSKEFNVLAHHLDIMFINLVMENDI